MEPIQLTTQEFYLYTILANTALGFMVGLVPLAAGFIKGQRTYAFFGLVACVVGGAILGIFLSIPLAALFTWLIFRAANSKPGTVSADGDNDSPAS